MKTLPVTGDNISPSHGIKRKAEDEIDAPEKRPRYDLTILLIFHKTMVCVTIGMAKRSFVVNHLEAPPTCTGK